MSKTPDQIRAAVARRIFTAADLAKIVMLHAEGRTLREIAEIYGCSHTSVRRALERFAEAAKAAGGPPRRRRARGHGGRP
jgi:DNA-binding GntR family transcriptional regulator